MFCYKQGDLIKVPQNTWLYSEESLHNSLLYPKSITNGPTIGCVISTQKDGDVLKVFVKNEYFLVRSKDVYFANRMERYVS
tara:strand:+ start:210 stop:452 length:243 start_codon:yes stop_codon:yes gene_type:complete